MLRFLAYNFARLFVVVLGVAALNFILIQLAPGDPAIVLAGEAGAADELFLERLREKFGLNQPLYVQMLHYFSQILRFDLGVSYRQGIPVLDIILQRLPATLYLTIPAFILSLTVGIIWGLSAARQKRGPRLAAFTAVTAVFNAAPVFWVALILVLVFSMQLGWFPAFGMRMAGVTLSPGAMVLDILHHAILPVITLSLFYIAVYARMMRSSALEVQDLDYVKTARAKGVPRSRIIRRHIAPNAILPIIAFAGMQAGQLIGGSVVIETVFAWPGIGRLAFDALLQRDYPILMGILLVTSVVVVLINIITDLVVSYFDPRIEIGA